LEVYRPTLLLINFHQLANHGGQAVQVVHNLREELVTRAFGDNPPVNLTSLGGIASFALRCFAMVRGSMGRVTVAAY
jgi:hypothetical protein